MITTAQQNQQYWIDLRRESVNIAVQYFSASAGEMGLPINTSALLVTADEIGLYIHGGVALNDNKTAFVKMVLGQKQAQYRAKFFPEANPAAEE